MTPADREVAARYLEGAELHVLRAIRVAAELAAEMGLGSIEGEDETDAAHALSRLLGELGRADDRIQNAKLAVGAGESVLAVRSVGEVAS